MGVFWLVLFSILVKTSIMSIESEASIVLVAVTALMVLLVAFLLIFGVLYQRSRLKRQIEKMNYDRALLKTQIEIREHTLGEISRDLHDNFGQIVSLVKIQLSMLSNEIGDKDKRKIDESKSLLQKLVEDVRNLSSAMSSRKINEKGWVEMMLDDINRLNDLEIIKMTYLVQDSIPELTPNQQVFFYRIFQELLNNTLKHSEASEAEVKLVLDDKGLIFSLTDNGIGIPSTKLEFKGCQGNGFKNIKERASLIGANFHIESTIHYGTYAEISLPITQNNEN